MLHSRTSIKLWFMAVLCGFGLLMAWPSSGAQTNVILGGVSMALQDITPQTAVYYTSMRLNRALNVWNVEAAVSNTSALTFSGPMVLVVDSAPGTTGLQQPDGSLGGSPLVDLSGQLTLNTLHPGQLSAKHTLILGLGSGTPSLVTRVFAMPFATNAAAAFLRTEDSLGQPLGSVTVLESGPSGTQTNQSDPTFGIATLGQSAGAYSWQFTAPGYLPVWRQQILTSNGIARVISPRLTLRSTNTISLTPLGNRCH